jgi:uncharacterized membrane protein
MGKKNKTNQVTVRHQSGQLLVQQQQYSGVLPLPTHLEKYEEILPGAAERIMKMAEDQSVHRRSLESKAIDSDIKNSQLGLWFGFIIGVFGIGCGAFLMYSGKLIEGGLIGGGTLASLVGVFIYGSRQRRLERTSRQQQESSN